MLVIVCAFHPRFQQIAIMDADTGGEVRQGTGEHAAAFDSVLI